MRLQAWYATHPPKRGDWWMGTRPFVHQGFLKSWVANGLNKRIVERCVMAVKTMQAQAHGTPVNLYITGAIRCMQTRAQGSRSAVAATLQSMYMQVDLSWMQPAPARMSSESLIGRVDCAALHPVHSAFAWQLGGLAMVCMHRSSTQARFQ